MNTATYVPPTREQVDTIRRVLVHERDIERAAILLAAATCPSVKVPPPPHSRGRDDPRPATPSPP